MRIPDKEFPAGSPIYAMFPETSTFYEAVVIEPPSVYKNKDQYLVRFDDDQDDDGETPLRPIDASVIILNKAKQKENDSKSKK